MSIMRIVNSCISPDMNELRVHIFHAKWEIRTHESYASNSRHRIVTSGGVLTFGGWQWRDKSPDSSGAASLARTST